MSAILDDLNDYLSDDPWEEKPVGIREFVYSPRYLNLSQEGQEAWPEVVNDLENHFESRNREAVWIMGIGSGKSYRAEIAVCYGAYVLCCLKNPQRVLGLSPKSLISFMNMSTRAKQAKDVIFDEIATMINASPWFQKSCKPDPKKRSELRFPKRIVIIPGNSKEQTPIGYNLFGAVMDECSFYTETEDHDVAEAIYNSLLGRLKSRFENVPDWLPIVPFVIMISSPRYDGDFTERKFMEAENKTTITHRRLETWNAKPDNKYCGETFDMGGIFDIPIEFKDEFERNFELARRDYAALPSTALEPFDWRAKEIVKIFNTERVEPFDSMSWSGNELYIKWNYDALKIDGRPRFIHVDLGLNRSGTGDCAGFAMATIDGFKERFKSDVNGNEVMERNPMIYLDMYFRIRAPPGGEILFSGIRGLIYELKSMGYNIYVTTYDGWQSTDSIQQLKLQGIKAETLSLDRDISGYLILKEAQHDDRLDRYQYEPFEQEYVRLEIIKGVKVDHPPRGSKDVTDAVAGVCESIAKYAMHVAPERVTKTVDVPIMSSTMPYEKQITSAITRVGASRGVISDRQSVYSINRLRRR